MDKRKIENARVKKSIEDAFFILLKEKNFSEITVTDIINKSGIARASYYRNFNSKEDIIKDYMQNLREEIELALGYSQNSFSDALTCPSLAKHLAYYLKEKHTILLLYDNGFGTLMLEEINHYIEEALGDMQYNSIDRYMLYFISGAIFNTMIQWFKSGSKEAPMEMAQMLLKLFEKIFPQSSKLFGLSCQ